jgi:transposase
VTPECGRGFFCRFRSTDRVPTADQGRRDTAPGIRREASAWQRQLEAVKTVEGVCKIALSADKNEILLYMELATLTRDREQIKATERLIKEEKAHLAREVSPKADYDPLYAVEKFGKLC